MQAGSAQLRRVSACWSKRIVAPNQRTAPGRDRVTIDIAADILLSGSGSTVPLQNGDVVRVFPISERVRNRITVSGNVNLPGPQGLTPGMTLSQALREKVGPKSDTYLGEVLITRLRSDSSRVQLRATLADTIGNVINDLALQEDDEIMVYSLTTFRANRYVAIGGAVNKGGRFPYREGMRLRDLVLLANGVQESAWLVEAEIAGFRRLATVGALRRRFVYHWTRHIFLPAGRTATT